MNVAWLSLHDDAPARGMWDQALLEDLLAEDTHSETLGDTPTIVILPGATHAGEEAAVSDALAPLPGVVLLVTSDEEARFDPSAVTHPAIRRWSQYGPRRGCRPLPVGYTPHTRPALTDADPSVRVYDVSFAGQVTHDRRAACVAAIEDLGCVTQVVATDGFAQGLRPEQYIAELAHSRIVACPPGPVHGDTFRVWEALEAGAVPVVDDSSRWLASVVGPSPLPTVSSWASLGGVVEEVLADWPWWAARCQGWWLERKRSWRAALVADVEGVSG